MLTKHDLERLAQTRLDDASLLFAGGRYSSSYYLTGYAVELAIKACIANLIPANAIPDKGFINAIYTHKLDSLLSTAGLRPHFDTDAKTDLQFAVNWSIVNNWSQDSRYQFWDQFSTATLLTAINDPNHGVFRWVQTHW